MEWKGGCPLSDGFAAWLITKRFTKLRIQEKFLDTTMLGTQNGFPYAYLSVLLIVFFDKSLIRVDSFFGQDHRLIICLRSLSPKNVVIQTGDFTRDDSLMGS